MPFWKQSDDPWERKPGERRPKPKEPMDSPLDSLKAWNEGRKAAAKEKEAAKRLPPEKCPWCGKDMEQGFLLGGRDGTRWYPGIYAFAPLRGLTGEAMDILTDSSGFTSYKTTWLCRECGKMVFDIPESERIYDFPELRDTETTETKEEEDESEE